MTSSHTGGEALQGNPTFQPDFSKGLLPAIAQDCDSGEVLMLAYMNEESLRLTIQIGEAVYYSRSRKELWHKGKTSGEIQRVEEMLTDCDQDAIVLRITQMGGGCCHTKRPNCFYRRIPVGDATDGPITMTKDD